MQTSPTSRAPRYTFLGRDRRRVLHTVARIGLATQRALFPSPFSPWTPAGELTVGQLCAYVEREITRLKALGFRGAEIVTDVPLVTTPVHGSVMVRLDPGRAGMLVSSCVVGRNADGTPIKAS